VGEIRRFVRSLPALFFEKAKVSCPDELKEPVMSRVKEKTHLLGAGRVNTLDGLRLDFPDSWLLIRASGTEPVIRIIAESPSEAKSLELISKGRNLIQDLVEAKG